MLLLDVGPGLLWSAGRSIVGTVSFVAYLAVAVRHLSHAREPATTGETAHRERSDPSIGVRARRRVAFVAWTATLAYALVAIAPGRSSRHTWRKLFWPDAPAEGRVLATLFGLALGVFVLLGLAVPAQRKIREAEPTMLSRFVASFAYATFAALAYGLYRAR